MKFRRPLTRRLLALLLAGALTTGCAGRSVPDDSPAVAALVQLYDLSSGVWPTTGWWNSANAMTALIDSMIASGDKNYLWVVENTYAKKRYAAQGNFINPLTDDTGWWALAWIRAFDLTGDHRYLDTARRDVDFMWTNHDDVCGGGLWWTTNHEYKNAISNELYMKAAAELATRLDAGGQVYLLQAQSIWNWFAESGLTGDDMLVNDGLDHATCRNNHGTRWTYNQGVLLGGLVALAQATGDPKYLTRARELADASSASQFLNIDGTLTEPCENSGCDVNGPSFKGIYVRNLGELNRVLKDHQYSDYLAQQASTAYEKDRANGDNYGIQWAGPAAAVNAASQQSAVDLLVAAAPIDAEPDASGSAADSSAAGGPAMTS